MLFEDRRNSKSTLHASAQSKTHATYLQVACRNCNRRFTLLLRRRGLLNLAVALVVQFGRHSELFLRETVWGSAMSYQKFAWVNLTKS
jgi:hypothetical protein